MPVIYLDSNTGSDTYDGSSTVINGTVGPKASAAAALTAAGAAGRVWVRSTHVDANTGATKTLTSPGTANAWTEMLCAGTWEDNPATLGAGALIQNNHNISVTGVLYSYGVDYKCEAGNIYTLGFANSAVPGAIVIENGNVWPTSYGNSIIQIGVSSTSTDGNIVEFVNTKAVFRDTSHKFSVRGPFRWRNTVNALGGSTAIPTALIVPQASGNPGDVVLEGIDLSAMGAGKALVNVGADNVFTFLSRGVKLGSGCALTTGTVPGQGAAQIIAIATGASGAPHQAYQLQGQGEIQDSTVNYRSGGATHNDTPWSVKMTTFTGMSKWYSPLRLLLPMHVNVATIGAQKTITVHFIHDSLTDLTNADIWLEGMYFSETGSPLGSFVHDGTADILAPGVAQDASTESWTTSGITNVRKQKLAISFTPQLKGYVALNVYLAKDGYTVWVCPKPVVS